jgi:hypothetical protein
MDIILREDIAAPIAHVFAQATDTQAFERQALRRGADLRRLDRLPQPGPGAAWRIVFPFRGRERELEAQMTRLENPTLAEWTFRSAGLQGVLRAECLALSRTATRLTLALTLEGRSLTARLLVQSLRLARGSLERRAEPRLKAWSREVEARWQRRQARV